MDTKGPSGESDQGASESEGGGAGTAGPKGDSGTVTGGPRESWGNGVIHFLGEHIRTFLATLLVGVLAALSGQIIEGLKFRLNRANLRTERYQALASELSNFVFCTELVHEFFEENWTTLPTLKWLIGDYNAAITGLRKNEYVYIQYLSHYWDDEKVEQFNTIMELSKKIDGTIHKLNDELARVENDNEHHKKVNRVRARKVAGDIEADLASLQVLTRYFLIGLQ